jgi:hypothetical protein
MVIDLLCIERKVLSRIDFMLWNSSTFNLV